MVRYFELKRASTFLLHFMNISMSLKVEIRLCPLCDRRLNKICLLHVTITISVDFRKNRKV